MAEDRYGEAMRKRGARIHHTRTGHILTPNQVEALVMPIHMALELLPLGLYTQEHGHDLAAFLNVAQFAADDARRPDMLAQATAAAGVLVKMRDRVRSGQAWNVTADERDVLMRSVAALDRWYRGCNTTRWRKALAKVYAICDRAIRDGKQELDLLEVAT